MPNYDRKVIKKYENCSKLPNVNNTRLL